MAEKSKSKKHDVMISYNWDSKPTVLKIREKLKVNGITCWIDVEQMRGSTLDAMSEAVENCTVFLMCYSSKYSKSANCKSEAEYAKQKDKIIIPCKMERGFNASGWLGMILGSKLFFEFSEKYPFDKKIEELLQEIKFHLQTEDDQENGGNDPDREKSGKEQALSLSPSITEVREFTVPDIDHIFHMSLDKSGKLWASDQEGNLVQTDLQGNQLQKTEIDRVFEGYHTVTRDGDLIYADTDNKVICRMKNVNSVTEFTETGDWEPISIHFSYINRDLLVGMTKGEGAGAARVVRYSKTGTEIQSIERDSKGTALYGGPHYITENINGDICASDCAAVVVVSKAGQHRFSYTGQDPVFDPYGICTDLLGHILVCDNNNETVDLLDQDGQFLSQLLTKQQGVTRALSVCVDEENNLLVGQYDTNKVKVYKYLQ